MRMNQTTEPREEPATGQDQKRTSSQTRRGSKPAEEWGLSDGYSGNTFTGRWIQDESSQRCASEFEGSFYWGRFELTLNGDRLDGHFGYCDQTPDREWHWTRSG
ncbi:MAG: hypothetical protein AB7E72_19595, partial [Lysobacterales bacterium]